MRKSRFTEEQMVAIIREADRDGVPAAAKRHKLSEQTLYAWKKRFGTFQPDDVRRLKQLEQDNARLKKPVAERDLEIEVMKEITAKNGERAGPPGAGDVCDAPGRVAAEACTLMKVSRSALGYRSRLAVKSAPVLARMAALSAQYPRYGYRRMRIFLDRDGHAMSPGRAYRLCRRAGLQLPRRRPRKRVASGRPRPHAPNGANKVWAIDFVFDACADGRQRKCLTVADEFTGEGLAVEVDGRIRSGRVVEVLTKLVSQRGAPAHLRCDNGPEFVARAVLKWIVDQGIGTAFIDPGKPWQNGVNESFNGKFCDECPSVEWFRSRAEAKVVIESWRRHFNTERPHSSLGYLTPAAFAAKLERLTAAPTTATGRGAALAWGSVPRPVASPSRKGHSKPAAEGSVST